MNSLIVFRWTRFFVIGFTGMKWNVGGWFCNDIDSLVSCCRMFHQIFFLPFYCAPTSKDWSCLIHVLFFKSGNKTLRAHFGTLLIHISSAYYHVLSSFGDLFLFAALQHQKGDVKWGGLLMLLLLLLLLLLLQWSRRLIEACRTWPVNARAGAK